MAYKKGDTPPKTQTDIRNEVNQKIIAALESGNLPFWNRPWKSGVNCSHHNVVNNKNYRGVNTFVLALTAQAMNYPYYAWGSFKQWKDCGGTVKKGEKGTPIVFWHIFDTKEVDNKGKPKKGFMLRFYSTFNLAQVDPLESKKLKTLIEAVKTQEVEKPTSKDFEVANKIVAACEGNGLKIVHRGDRAFWTEGTDGITMPIRSSFKSNTDYFQTLWHEIGHWTENRLKWDRKTHGYAMGELRAEICSCYLSQASCLPAGKSADMLNNHAAYIKHWLEQMRSDNRWIFQACKFADEAADCVLKIAGMSEPNGKEEEAEMAA